VRAGKGPVAMLDRCPHRGAALSEGRMTAPGNLQCAYHVRHPPRCAALRPLACLPATRPLRSKVISLSEQKALYVTLT